MKLNVPFRPKLFDTLKGDRARDFIPDLTAGVTVGIVALPLAMAFAIASGERIDVVLKSPGGGNGAPKE